MLKKFFDHKLWVLLSAAITVLALLLLAAGLGGLHFRAGRPISLGETTTLLVSVEKITAEIVDIPFWKQLVFGGLVFLLVILVASIFPPDLRRRILKIFLRMALFALALLFLMKNFPGLFPALDLSRMGASEGAGPTAMDSPPPVFTVPQVPPAYLYLASLAVLLVLAGFAFLTLRWWLRRQPLQKDSNPLEDLAGIARTSLADIAAGRAWEHAVIQCYARMTDLVETRRGLHRRSDLTAAEFAVRLEEAGLPGDAVRRLTRLFEAARYGTGPASREERSEAITCLEMVMHACGVDE